MTAPVFDKELTESERVVAALRAAPGEWAWIRTYPAARAGSARQYAYQIRRGTVLARDLDAVSRRFGDVYRVYARFLGEKGGA